MRKGAELTVLAALHFVGVCLAEFALILLRMVEFLHAVVGLEAVFSVVDALIMELTVGDIRTHLRSVGTQRPPPIFLVVVIEEAPLRVVLVSSLGISGVFSLQERAGLSLELGQVKEYKNVVRALLLPGLVGGVVRHLWIG